MKLDYNRLSELLNSFGISLKTENGSVIFVDVEKLIISNPELLNNSDIEKETSNKRKV